MPHGILVEIEPIALGGLDYGSRLAIEWADASVCEPVQLRIAGDEGPLVVWADNPTPDPHRGWTRTWLECRTLRPTAADRRRMCDVEALDVAGTPAFRSPWAAVFRGLVSPAHANTMAGLFVGAEVLADGETSAGFLQLMPSNRVFGDAIATRMQNMFGEPCDYAVFMYGASTSFDEIDPARLIPELATAGITIDLRPSG